MMDDFQYIPVMDQGMPQGFSSGVPMPQVNDRADLVEKIKPELIIFRIKNELMGKIEVDGAWVVDPNLKDLALTPQGASQVAQFMLGSSTLNISLSKLEEHKIQMRVIDIVDSLQWLLLSNWRKFGIHNVAQIKHVTTIVQNNTMAIFHQALKGSIQDLIKNTTTQKMGDPIMQRKDGLGSKIRRAFGLGG